MFHRTDFGGFLVCCYKAIQQLNGVEKNYVAISLMLNHNLTGLWLGIRKMRARFVLRILPGILCEKVTFAPLNLICYIFFSLYPLEKLKP